MIKDICSMIDIKKKYFIYGTEILGKYVYEKVREKYGNDLILAFVETCPNLDALDRRKRIISLEEAVKLMNDTTCIIITGQASADEMRDNCIRYGVKDSQIIMVPSEIKNYLKTGYAYPVNSVCFWPPITADNERLQQKINFYLPNKIAVTIFAEDNSKINLLERDVCICNPRDKEKVWDSMDYILLWDVMYEDELFAKYPEKVRIVDAKYWEHLDTTNYIRIYHDSLSRAELQVMLDESKRNFQQLELLAENYRSATIFCSGPSIGEVYEMEENLFDKEFSIICNSMIKDRDLLERLQPKVLCFFDSNFFHSPGEYGEAFYKDLRETYDLYGYYIIVKEIQKPLLLEHCPNIKDKVIGVPSRNVKEYWFISQEKFSCRPLENILTDIMIPIASALFDNICIAGCTGRSNENNYFWKHNEHTQYMDLKKYVMEMWPAFFHYRDYEAYYDRHCQIVEEQIRYGESLGKKYTNITTSFIPALMKRTLPKK